MISYICSSSMVFLFCSLKFSFMLDSFNCLDTFSSFMMSIVPIILGLISLMVFSYQSLKDYLVYTINFSFICFCFSACLMTLNSLVFLFWVELSLVPLGILSILFSKDKDKFSSSCFLILMSLLGSLPFMFILYYIDSSFNNLCLNFSCYQMFLMNEFWTFFCCFFIFICKIPVVIFHFWLTKVHVSSSTSTSALLASIMLKIGTFGFMKFSLIFFILFEFFIMFSVTMVFSLWFFLMVMFRCVDMKYMVACSSISHMSSLPLIMSNMDTLGVFSSLLMMVGHGIVSFLFFILVGLVYEKSFSRSFDFNKSLESSAKSLVMLIFLVSVLNLGFPPYMTFLSELFCVGSLFKFSILCIFLFSIFFLLGVVYFMNFCLKILFGKKSILFNFPFNFLYSFHFFFFVPFGVILLFMF